MIAFIILRDYIFGLFSVTGMEREIFWIAIFGSVIMLSIPFSMISSKMLDGFGKSMYSLVLTLLKIVLEMILISLLNYMTHNADCVLIGMTISEILLAIIYYMALRYLFKNFNYIYKDKRTVKTFDSDDESESLKDNETGWKKDKIISKIPTILLFVFTAIVAIEIIMLPINLNDYHLLFGVLTSSILTIASIHLIEKFKKPTVSLLGIITSSIIFFVFMGRYGYAPTLLFIVIEAFLLCIKLILNPPPQVKNSVIEP